ncbi:MAG: tetratricopeptide repeat protein, partial [Chloroflexi bacterium]|nr:tetratricopeptide repeat protein [Chloroflexota bacterium]
CQPEPYYLEALRRDPQDNRCNNAMGRLLLRRGKFAQAERYLRAATASLTRRNPNPYDGEAFYNLGLALKYQGRYDEAFDALYKAVWNGAWASAACLELARLSWRRRQFDEALALLERALGANWHNHSARHLKIAFLRNLGRRDEAKDECALSLRLDRINYGAAFERMYLHSDLGFRDLMRDNVQTYIEVALDYAHAGLWPEAKTVLEEAPATDPMVLYYLGWCQQEFDGSQRVKPRAVRTFREAAAMPPDYCFPNRLECIAALETAMTLDPEDARAPYYLGNFWYAHRQYADAIACWEQSLALDECNPTAHRNLGLALMNKRGDAERALHHYERAFELDKSDARVLFELDQLHAKSGKPPAERLAFLQRHQAGVDQRDDLTIEVATLHNLLGQPGAALDIIMRRNFHPWEGGEGKVTGQYVTSLIQLARGHLERFECDRAIDCLTLARSYPHNLGEGKLLTVPENDVFYYLGLAYELRGDAETARPYYEGAARGAFEPASPKYYNDQPPESIYYQGLAREKLGEHELARSIFERLIEYGEAHLYDEVTMDYFAVSLPNFLVFEDDLSLRNHIHCLYLIALGRLGVGDRPTAERHFDDVLARDPNHLGATLIRQFEAAQFAAKVGK